MNCFSFNLEYILLSSVQFWYKIGKMFVRLLKFVGHSYVSFRHGQDDIQWMHVGTVFDDFQNSFERFSINFQIYSVQFNCLQSRHSSNKFNQTVRTHSLWPVEQHNQSFWYQLVTNSFQCGPVVVYVYELLSFGVGKAQFGEPTAVTQNIWEFFIDTTRDRFQLSKLCKQWSHIMLSIRQIEILQTQFMKSAGAVSSDQFQSMFISDWRGRAVRIQRRSAPEVRRKINQLFRSPTPSIFFASANNLEDWKYPLYSISDLSWAICLNREFTSASDTKSNTVAWSKILRRQSSLSSGVYGIFGLCLASWLARLWHQFYDVWCREPLQQCSMFGIAEINVNAIDKWLQTYRWDFSKFRKIFSYDHFRLRWLQTKGALTCSLSGRQSEANISNGTVCDCGLDRCSSEAPEQFEFNLCIFPLVRRRCDYD